MTEPNTITPDTEPVANAPADTAPAGKSGKQTAKKPKGDAAKLAALEQKAADAEEKLKSSEDAFKRLAAEYDNFRKRSQKEHDTAFSNGVSHAAEMLLPVLDTLEAAANAETADADYKKGVLLTLKKCAEIFGKMGIQEIDAQGQPFDPELHNACLQEPCEDVASGCVAKVMQKGYTLNGRVIRHAMVSVAE